MIRAPERAAEPVEDEEDKGPEGALSSYVPEDPKLDTQLNYAFDLLRGVQVNAAFPATAEQGIPN